MRAMLVAGNITTSSDSQMLAQTDFLTAELISLLLQANQTLVAFGSVHSTSHLAYLVQAHNFSSQCSSPCKASWFRAAYPCLAPKQLSLHPLEGISRISQCRKSFRSQHPWPAPERALLGGAKSRMPRDKSAAARGTGAPISRHHGLVVYGFS